MRQVVKSMFPDIHFFPKIANSYAIKSSASIKSLNPLSEWSIFGWDGYRIGTYYDNYEGGGFLYLASDKCAPNQFDESNPNKMPNMRSAVAYAWLTASERLKEGHKGRGPVLRKHGIRAFAGGSGEQTIFSLFNSGDKLIGYIEETDAGYVGRGATIFGYEDLIHQLANETPDAILERLMKILRR